MNTTHTTAHIHTCLTHMRNVYHIPHYIYSTYTYAPHISHVSHHINIHKPHRTLICTYIPSHVTYVPIIHIHNTFTQIDNTHTFAQPHIQYIHVTLTQL